MNDEVRSWLKTAKAGTLSTILDDERTRGAPFGSPVPFALLEGANTVADTVVIVISNLAVHTKNLRADPRGSLLVSEPGHEDDPWSGWRVTLVGRFRPLTPDSSAGKAALDAFRAQHPRAPSLPGFVPWVLDVDATRFVAGFGKMGWL